MRKATGSVELVGLPEVTAGANARPLKVMSRAERRFVLDLVDAGIGSCRAQRRVECRVG